MTTATETSMIEITLYHQVSEFAGQAEAVKPYPWPVPDINVRPQYKLTVLAPTGSQIVEMADGLDQCLEVVMPINQLGITRQVPVLCPYLCLTSTGSVLCLDHNRESTGWRLPVIRREPA